MHGRNAVDWPERLALDVEYVEHAAFALDVRIVWRTLGMLVRRHGISGGGHVTMHEFMGET